MDLLTIILVYVLKMRAERDFLKVQKVFFLRNNFWCSDHLQFKTEDKVNLHKVSIGVECKRKFTVDYVFYSDTCYFLKYTNFGYLILGNLIKKSITSVLESPDVEKFLWRIRFFYNYKSVNNPSIYKNYDEKGRNFVTYKFLEKVPKNRNTVKLRCDGPDIRTEHIKEMFKGLICMKLFKLNDYIKDIGENKLKKKLRKMKNGTKIYFYHFRDYSECLENLRKFINDLCYLNLLNDYGFLNSFTVIFSLIFINSANTLMVSQFKIRFFEKFNEDLKRFKTNETDEDWKLLFDRCFDYIKDEILKNNMFFPIGGKYDINYYIGQFSNIIFETVKEIKEEISLYNSEKKSFIFFIKTESLKDDLRNLQIKAVQDFYEFEFIIKHFSNLLGKEVETLDDFIEIEKMVCDYHNMFAYIYNLYHGLCKDSCAFYSYCSPIFIDNYNLKIIDGIEIKFNLSFKFGKIKGFDDKGREIIMMKDTDFYIDRFGALYCPSDVFEMKNIHEIEVISFNEKNNQKFKINEYLQTTPLNLLN